MNKSKRLKEIKEELWALEQEEKALTYGGLHKEAKEEFHRKIDEHMKIIKPELDIIRKKYRELEDAYDKIKNAPKKNVVQLSQRLKDWLTKYSQGVDWGYKGLQIREILDDEERFVIITNPGSTGGQGTAMGTMNYYYSRTSHWVVDTFVCDRAYDNTKRKGISSWGRIGDVEIEGRLTKEGRETLLKAVEEYKKLIGLS